MAPKKLPKTLSTVTTGMNAAMVVSTPKNTGIATSVPDNVAQAVRVTQARQIDVSSGVESAPGTKDMEKMRNFVAQARL